MTCSYADMSPLVLDKGYTRRYLDGDVDLSSQSKLITDAYERLISTKDIVIVEGTGHTGVGR